MTTERTTPDSRASSIVQWLMEQAQLGIELHPEQIAKRISIEIAQAEKLAHLPKIRKTLPGEEITTLTKAREVVADVLDTVSYLGVEPKNFMPVKMALKTLQANGVKDNMITRVHQLIIETQDVIIATVAPVLDAGCPLTDKNLFAACFYCQQQFSASENKLNNRWICFNPACPWGRLYSKVKGKPDNDKKESNSQ